MRYFTEFSLHKSNTISVKDIMHVVVVSKGGKQYCRNNVSTKDLLQNLRYLDSASNTGWFIDRSVGELIATCTIESHPEYFI